MSEDGVWFEGIRFPNFYQTENLRTACEKFVMKDEDTVIVSYPKSGTLWLIEILCLIHSRGDPKWVQSVPFWKRSPWIERRDAEQLDRDSEGPRFFTSHLPFHLFPKSFFTSKGKVIYIIRNPRDVLVSGYFFWSRTNFVKNPDSLEQFFEQFIQGNVPYGSWFEHICGWMSVRHRANVLLLSYEDLQKVSPVMASACPRPNILAPPDVPGPQFLPSTLPVKAEPLRGHKSEMSPGPPPPCSA
ncbi:sulfotransferase 2A1-like [Marmota marmota marmota]|uniref:Sulfotransferase n=1 Tax=Marmota marmota marmota TaxID=9994 RepID=A0A8C5ZGU8_MARMA|nr:sulfotransferase 2A1-like [Marmota marmota marmota]